jgi:transcription-repair coupling factor (superfamily II helicase)
MDDAPDRGESRAPQLQDVLDLCTALNREGARYLLIGGFAVILHGFVRSTKDVDFLVDPSEENIRAVKRAMATLPDNAAALLADDEVLQYQVVRVADEIVVDLLASACGVTYSEAAKSDIETFKVQDVRIPVASKEILIRMKDTIRESDALDVRFLHLRIDEEKKRRS